MKGYFLLILIFFTSLWSAQVVLKQDSLRGKEWTVDKGKKDSLKIFKPQPIDYLHFTERGEKKIFDTTFSIQQAVQYNQTNHRDNYGKISFVNHNQVLLPLLFEGDYTYAHQILPSVKIPFLIPSSQVQYYDVKTPTTSFYYHNAIRNGAVLKSTYTQNFGKNLNIAVDYIGIRSQGLYLRNLSNANKVTLSVHYQKNNYEAFAYYGHHNLNNEENGGIKTASFFLNGDNRFSNRLNFEVNLKNSVSRFSTRTYYLNHSLKMPDWLAVAVKLKHVFYVEGNKYYFDQSSPENFYTSEYYDTVLLSNKFSKKWNNNLGLLFEWKNFEIDASIKHQALSLGTTNPYQGFTLNNDPLYTEQRYGLEGRLKWGLGHRVSLNSNLEITNGSLLGQYVLLQNQLSFQVLDALKLNAHYHLKSSSPSLNLLFQPSFYKDFSHGLLDFKQETLNQIGGELQLKWCDTKLKADLFSVINYAYLDANYQFQQSADVLNVSQITAESHWNYKKWNIQAAVTAQKVISAASVLPLPGFITRLHLYYQSKAFSRHAELMTGLRTYFYSQFASREFFPIANEFAISNSSVQLGASPILDVYFNMKIKRMMIFIEGQQISNLIKKNQLLLTPNQPSMDFRFNLGVVWYLFN